MNLLRSGLATTLLAAALAPSAVLAQSGDLPDLQILDYYPSVVEGNHASTYARIPWSLTHASSSEIRFTVETEDRNPVSAVAGVDYVPLPPTQVIVPAGVTSGVVTFEVLGDLEVEGDETLGLRFSNLVGINGSSLSIPVYIYSTDGESEWVLTGNDDHVPFLVNTPLVTIQPELNDADVQQPDMLRDTVLTLTSLPQHGVVTQRKHQYQHATDVFEYVPEPDFAGRDEFGYRLCYVESQCVEAKVVLEGRLKGPAGAANRVGGQRWILSDMPALEDARYLASTLAVPVDVALATVVDGTPQTAWDSSAGMAWTTMTISATSGGQPAEFRIHAVSQWDYLLKVDLIIGVDSDGNGAPSAGEQRCFTGYALALNLADLRCEMTLEVGADPVTYWVAAHSREGTPQAPRLKVFQARMDANDGTLSATGPTIQERLDPTTVAVSWRDLSAAQNDQRIGYVRIVDGGDVIGDFRIDLNGGPTFLLLPQDGSKTTIDIAGSDGIVWAEREIFFDVPSGATSLTLTATSDRPVEFQLARFGFANPYEHVLDQSPHIANGNWVTAMPGQARTASVGSPQMGRWYAVVRNPGTQRARVELSVSLQGDYPAIRPGSYFNDKRSGSGVLLYPAGNQWAGLWYTYDRYQRPTWYYLQAPKPGANGIWLSPIYRSAWNGTTSRLTRVGTMSVTPISVATDMFLMSYTLDGSSGSEQMGPLGRGCPMFGGVPVDISSHWFDPVRAGTGYSVQMWEDYEFFAAFMYDHKGEPMFFLGESPNFAGAVADMDLELISGSCPTCSYGSGPVRRPAGVLRRTLSNGTLSEIQLDVDYEDTTSPTGRRVWTVTDLVQTLGGPGTTQGCDP